MNNPQIQEVISALGETIDNVAKKVGMSYSELAEYATTPRDVPDDVVEKIAGALGVDPSLFFSDAYTSLSTTIE